MEEKKLSEISLDQLVKLTFVPATLTLHSVQHHFLYFQARNWEGVSFVRTLIGQAKWRHTASDILSHHAPVKVTKSK